MRPGHHTKYVAILFFYQLVFLLHAQQGTNFYWGQYYLKKDISKQLTYQFDGGFRWRSSFNQPSQYILRTNVLLKFNNRWSTGAGIAQLGFRNGDSWYRYEWRPYAELSHQSKYSQFSVEHRWRTELRLFRDQPVIPTDDPLLSHKLRHRYRLMLLIPLPIEQWQMQIGDEVFVHTGKTANGFSFNQNRLLIGPKYTFSDQLNISFLFNFQTTGLGNNQHKNDYVCWLGINHRL